MSLSSEQIEAFEALGLELESAGWTPASPRAEPFEQQAPAPKREKIRRAAAFLREFAPRIREALCKGPAVRPEIATTGNVAAVVADYLNAVGGFPVPVWAIANAVTQYGLGLYCARTDRPLEEISV